MGEYPLQIKKSNLYYTRGITSKRVRSGGAYLCRLHKNVTPVTYRLDML